MKPHSPSPVVFWQLLLLACGLASCRPAKPATDNVAKSATQRPADYAGHETCAECHADIAATHARTGHARTFALTKDSAIAARLCNSALTVAEPYGRYEYSCDEEGVMVALPKRFGDRAFPLEYALGSGDHAVTFFTLLQKPTGDTIGLEHRMTWYRSDESFDVTPSHEDLLPELDAEYFGRVIELPQARQCIDCHTTTVEFDENRLTSLYAGVHCEECHGPGAKHVSAARAGDAAGTLRNIIRVKDAAEEMEQCGRCHRTAKDITPERLAAYPRSVIRFQPVGLSKSRCFQETKGGLRCTHCHDPHSPVASRSAEQQVNTCRECHSSPGQTPCPVSPAADCIRCHMPAVDLVRGISFHDHWIRVRKGEDASRTAPDRADHATIK
jgi:hypothetical protein